MRRREAADDQPRAARRTWRVRPRSCSRSTPENAALPSTCSSNEQPSPASTSTRPSGDRRSPSCARESTGCRWPSSSLPDGPCILTPDEIVAGLVDRFELLRGSSSDPRHSALSTTLMWSWELLDADDQHTLCRLAAFASGVDIAELGAALDREQWEAVDVVQRLRAKSLVSVEMGPTHPSRAHLLESVRMLAIDRAQEPGNLDRPAEPHIVDGSMSSRRVSLDSMVTTIGRSKIRCLISTARATRSARRWNGPVTTRSGRWQSVPASSTGGAGVTWRPTRSSASRSCSTRRGNVDAEVRCEALATLVLMRRIAGFDRTRTAELIDEVRRLVDAIPDGATRDRLELRYYEAAFDVGDDESTGAAPRDHRPCPRRGDESTRSPRIS